MHGPCLSARRPDVHNCVKTVQRGTGIASRAVMARVLVIDDDEVIAELLQSVLSEGGHAATAVPSLDAKLPDRVDLVITDLVTANPYSVGGAGAWVGEVRRRMPGVPVIVCTAHRDAANAGDDIAADAVLTKPFDLEVLLALVQRLAPEGRAQAT